jgi:hypothetical protein
MGLAFDWMDGELKDGAESITGRYKYHEVFDDYRQYSRRTSLPPTAGDPDEPSDADATSGDRVYERSWNGSLMRIYDHGSGTGSVRGQPAYLKASEMMVLGIIGRDHSGRSWRRRYDERDSTGTMYVVMVAAGSDDMVKVIERPREPARVYSEQAFTFDRSKGWAVTHWRLDNVNTEDNTRSHLSDISYEDFRLVDGVYVPFETRRTAEARELGFTGVQHMEVKEVTIDDASHERCLSSLDFPEGARLYDYILNMPVYVGMDDEGDLDQMLAEEVQKAIGEIGEAGTRSGRAEAPEPRAPGEGADRGVDGARGWPWKLVAAPVLGVLVLLLLVAARHARGRKLTALLFGCSLCFIGSRGVARAVDTDPFLSSFGDMTAEHRAIHERDLTRLCGINCLYQAYLLTEAEPRHSYRDVMGMVEYMDGVTMKELLDGATKLGMKPRAKLVNCRYLLQSKDSIMVALVQRRDSKAHFILFVGTPDDSSVYYIDHPFGQGRVGEEAVRSRFEAFGADAESIPVAEFVRTPARIEGAGKTVFSPARISVVDDRPWRLGDRTFKFSSELINRGTHGVRIADLKKSCHCVDVQFARMSLGPGERVSVAGEVVVTPGSSSTQEVVAVLDTGDLAILAIDVSSELPFELSDRQLSLGMLAATDSKTACCDVLVDARHPLRLHHVDVRGKPQSSYTLSASVECTTTVLWGDEATVHTKYTVKCGILTEGSDPLYAAHDLVLTFRDDSGHEYEHAVPVRFRVLRCPGT